VLRTTQFHDLIAVMLRLLAKPPVMMVPAGWSFQPIDVREVGARLAALAMSQPAGRVPDLAGPEICTIEDLARTYRTAVRKRRPIVSVPLPGRVCRAYRAGGHVAPARAVGTIAFEQYLGEQLAAGTLRPGVSCRTRTLPASNGPPIPFLISPSTRFRRDFTTSGAWRPFQPPIFVLRRAEGAALALA
jgi:hypothetical protein